MAQVHARVNGTCGARDGVKRSLAYSLRLRRPWFARFRFSRFMAGVTRLGFAPPAPVLVANGITPEGR